MDPTLTDHSTRYAYPLTADARQIGQQGVESLEAYAPYVLAFNHEIDSIEIVRDGQRRMYQRQPIEALDREQAEAIGGKVTVTPVHVQGSSGEQPPSFLVASVTGEAVTVAVAAIRIGDSREVQFGPQVPRLFMAFPLFGTEAIGFPGVINSRLFRPQKDRDGLYLGPEKTEDNSENKRLIERACALFVTLLTECAKAKWKGIHLLCNLTATAPRGVDEKWLHPLIKTSLVEPIRSQPLVSSCGGKVIAARDAWIPLGSPSLPGNALWEVLQEYNVSDDMLVDQVTATAWEANVRAWASVLGVPPEQMEESYTLKDCAETLSEFGSFGRLRQELRAGCDPLAWCSNLFDLMIRTGQTPLFDSLSILPDQDGTFQKRNALRLDREINEELKDIGKVLGLPVRSGLLHKDVTSTDLHKLLQVKSQNDVLVEITSHLRAEAAKQRPVAGFRQGNLQLFAWLLNHKLLEYLESFPALTQEPEAVGEAPNVVTLVRKGEPDSIPLAPPECWPEGARSFTDLFPMRHVLASAYHAQCQDQELWAGVESEGFVRLTPIFETTDFVQDFLPDVTLTDDTAHRSKERIATTQIAFLREKNIGLMDAARKSKPKCLLLLRFLAAYMIRTDPAWKHKLNVKCECDKSHDCWRAGWVAPLTKNKWIYLDRNRSDHLSVDSLAMLLKDDKEIVSLLAEDEGPSFLAALGVSAGDFLMRSATPDEEARVNLSKSLIQMLGAVGGDISQMTDLAQEIADHPETVTEIKERREIRRKINRNQNVGKAVEEAFQAALGSGHGLSVERAPIGSDYSVEPENDYLDADGKEILLHVSSPTDKFLVEIKATVGQHVRMTEVQGKKAKDNSSRYALCVVVLPDQEEMIDEALIRAKAKFVTDIGTKIKPFVEAVESLKGSRRGVLTRSGSIEVEMVDQAAKFKVGHELWEAGIGFEDAVRHFGGRIDAATIPTVGSRKGSRNP